jgi:hypothetical protein
MRINICPSGEKCAYKNWLMAAAFAVVAVSFMSFGTHAQAQTPQSPCTKSSAPAPTPTVTDEELLLGPATMGMMGGGDYLGYIGFANAYSIIVGKPVEILMTKIISKNAPIVPANDLNENQPAVPTPCVGTVTARQ